MLHTISLGAVMAALWMLLSGYFEPLMLSYGLFSVVVTLWISHRMDVVDHEGHPIHLAPRALLIYWPWLGWQVMKANLDIAKIILSPRLNIQPQIFDTQSSQHSEVGRTLYANSITLTPGTVTIDMGENGIFTVHALTTEARLDVQTLAMDKRCTNMEGIMTVPPTPPSSPPSTGGKS